MDQEYFINDLFEYVLTQAGYLLRSAPPLKGTQAYHALFMTAFHGDLFLSLYVTATGVEMVLGRGDIPWQWYREALNNGPGFKELPPEATEWIQLLAMEEVPNQALERFQQQMKKIQLFELRDASGNAEAIRDGMSARGIFVEEKRTHRFNIRAGYTLTDEQISFFQIFIELGCVTFATPTQKLLREVLRYLP